VSTISREHWQGVYQSRPEAQTSWYRPRLDESLRLVAAHAGDRAGPVLDVGGGRSTFVDDLLALGYRELAVLDVSSEALQQSRQRLAAAQGDAAAKQVRWIETDILGADLPMAHYALWHDRAVFHFLVDDSEQAAYAALAARSIHPGGVAIIACFAPDGPERCSGLPVQRYDATSLVARFGTAFTLLASSRELHAAPVGAAQAFTYVALRRVVPATEPRAAHATP
jgi:SAM-dependent methyltransferase